MRGLAILGFILATVAVGCASAADVEEVEESGESTANVVSGPAVAGIPSAFDHNRVMDDSFYADSSWATADEIQGFLENTIWDRPSWLATEKLGGVPVSQAIVTSAKAHHINPLLLLARMQVEKSLVSAEKKPSESARSFGLGCHKPTAAHPNGLDPSVAALDIQLACGATTLENQLTKAQTGDNSFDIGKDVTTQDGVRIHVSNAATSALYSYTPIEGTKAHNGNWLVWNVTQRFAAAIQAAR